MLTCEQAALWYNARMKKWQIWIGILISLVFIWLALRGLRTLAVRLGRRGALLEYVGLLAVAYAVPLGLAVSSGRLLLLLPCATGPVAVARVRALAGAVTGPEYNACLAATGALMMAHGVLFAVALWL